MLAVYRGPHFAHPDFGRRITSSLGLFSGDPGKVAPGDGALYAFADDFGPGNRPGSTRRSTTRDWAPARDSSGQVILFKGWLDNQEELAAELSLPHAETAELYGAALHRWGDAAEARLIGNYCAIVDLPNRAGLRLSRSALAAPPLHYMHDGAMMMAASVPRALAAAGLTPQLNPGKLVDTLLSNPTGSDGFLAGTWRVGVGEIVYLDGRGRRSLRTFDPLRPRKRLRGRLSDHVSEVDQLLQDAAAAALRCGSRPGVLLSGGLDSSNVAARVLRALPEPARLSSFTFGPLPEWRDLGSDLFFGDERPAVAAFAAMHPRIDPVFADNAGHGFDRDLDKLFLAMGAMPGVTAPAFAFRELFALARDRGCDLLLASDLGNFTFSNNGSWGFGEYLRTGRWRQLYAALRRDRQGVRSLLRRFLSRSIVPHLPDRWWRAWKRATGQDVSSDNEQTGFVRADAVIRSDAVARAKAAGTWYERDQYAWRSDMIRDQYARGDADSGDLLQGLEQVYGVRFRDVTAYRPLVEYCLALPTEAYLNKGEGRWLARELGRGLMPEAQRTERRVGFQAADWHQRLTPRLAEFAAEIARSRNTPQIAEVIDLDRMQKLIDSWPADPPAEPGMFAGHAVGLTRALTAIRYIRFVTGTNR